MKKYLLSIFLLLNFFSVTAQNTQRDTIPPGYIYFFKCTYTVPFATIGIDSHINSVIKGGAHLQSYVPGRQYNDFSGFTTGGTYQVARKFGDTTTLYLSAPTIFSSNAFLSGIVIPGVTLTPTFAQSTLAYSAAVANSVSSVTIAATTAESHAVVRVNGVATASGAASAPVAITVGVNTIPVIVTAQDNTTVKNYNVIVTRAGPGSGLITFSQPANMTVGDADQALTVSSNNTGTPIVLTTDNTAVATIVNNSLHAVSAGAVNVLANQDAGNGYTVATQVSKAVTIAANINASPLGDLYNQTTWADASDFILSNATATVSNGKLVLTPTATGNNSIVSLNKATCLEQFKITVDYTVNSLSSVSATGVGINSINTFLKASQFTGLSFASAGSASNQNAFSLYSGATIATTAGTVTANAGDIIEQTYEQVNANTLTITAKNLTTGSATVTATTASGTDADANTGYPAIYLQNGSITLQKLLFTSTATKNAALLIVGDSKTHGTASTTLANRYASKTGALFATYTVDAGGGDRTTEVLARLPELVALHAGKVLLAIGCNDPRSGIAQSTTIANLTMIRNALIAGGAGVYIAEPFYETAQDLTAQVTALHANFPSNKIISTFSALQGVSGSLASDGVHPTDLGHNLEYQAIVADGKLLGNTASLTAPTVLTGTPGDSWIPLTITPVTGATNYVVSRNTSNTLSGATQLYSGSVLAFADGSLAPSTPYYYFVTAQGAGFTDSAPGTATGTTSAIVQLSNLVTNTTIIGTSIEAGYLLSSPATQSWPAVASAARSGSINNIAVSNSGVKTSLYQFAANTSNNVTFPATKPLIDGAGFNNGPRYGVSAPPPYDTVHANAINAATRVIVAEQFHKQFIAAQGDPNVTVTISGSLTGTTASDATLADLSCLTRWYKANKTGYSNANIYYSQSTTAGTTITIPFTIDAAGQGFTPLVAGCDGVTLTLSKYTITYDSGTPVSYDPKGEYYVGLQPGADNFNQQGFINDAHPKFGLSVGSHTCTVTISETGKKFFIEGGLLINRPQDVTSVPVYMPDLLNIVDNVSGIGAQLPTGLASNFVINQYSAARRANTIATYPTFINVAINFPAFVYGWDHNNLSNFNADGTHPSQSGAAYLGTNFLRWVAVPSGSTIATPSLSHTTVTGTSAVETFSSASAPSGTTYNITVNGVNKGNQTSPYTITGLSAATAYTVTATASATGYTTSAAGTDSFTTSGGSSGPVIYDADFSTFEVGFIQTTDVNGSIYTGELGNSGSNQYTNYALDQTHTIPVGKEAFVYFTYVNQGAAVNGILGIRSDNNANEDYTHGNYKVTSFISTDGTSFYFVKGDNGAAGVDVYSPHQEPIVGNQYGIHIHADGSVFMFTSGNNLTSYTDAGSALNYRVAGTQWVVGNDIQNKSIYYPKIKIIN